MRKKILFFSQQRLLRDSFEHVLSVVPDLTFLAPVCETDQAVASIHLYEPHVIVVDLTPSLNGLRVAKDLQTACPGCKLLLLSSHVDPIIETQLASAGVQGVLSKDISLDDFLWAIDRIAAGYCISRHDGKLVASAETPIATMSPALTSREVQILELIPKGFANKQIAAELDISIKTVEKHRQNLMSKLQAHETAGLTWRAVCLGVDGHSRD